MTPTEVKEALTNRFYFPDPLLIGFPANTPTQFAQLVILVRNIKFRAAVYHTFCPLSNCSTFYSILLMFIEYGGILFNRRTPSKHLCSKIYSSVFLRG